MLSLFAVIAHVLFILSGLELVLIYIPGVNASLEYHMEEYGRYDRSPREVYRIFMVLLYGSWIVFILSGIFIGCKNIL